MGRSKMKASLVPLAIAVVLSAGLAGCEARSSIVPGAPVADGVSDERLKRLDAHFERLVDEGRIAGFVTWISRRGKVVHEHAYGMANIAAKRPMTRDTYFYVYSMTKPVTSVALLMLYEEGCFQLNALGVLGRA